MHGSSTILPRLLGALLVGTLALPSALVAAFAVVEYHVLGRLHNHEMAR